MNARALLISGRMADARQSLVRAQAQSALQLVTPERPAAEGSNPTTARIGVAISMLDQGSRDGALQAIDMAMHDAAGVEMQPWPNYPPQVPLSYTYRAGPSYNYGGNDQ